MAVIAVMPASGATPAVARSIPSGAGAIENSSLTVISSAQAPSRTVRFACSRNPYTG
jgi:hypothetical protein